MSCDGGHLGFPIGIKHINFVENLPMRLAPYKLFFVPVGYSIWLPGPIISSDWLNDVTFV
jgi:hypothetical protein